MNMRTGIKKQTKLLCQNARSQPRMNADSHGSTRIKIMKTTSFLVALGLTTALTAAQQGGADLVLLNGRIYTVDAAKPWAEAIAVRDSRIVAVGTAAEVRPLAGPTTRTIDL